MKSILCVDVGNTMTKMALVTPFHVEVIQPPIHDVKNWVRDYNLEAMAVCTVNELPDWVHDLAELLPTLNISEHSKLPFINAYGSPETLGHDRLALVAAAQHLYPNQNNLVIALGTCITYNFISAQKVFRGGAISPGLMMRAKAMNSFTHALPLIEPKNTISILGYNTISSMQSGIMNGMIAEIEGMIQRFETEFENINVILTGGDMKYFETQIKNKIFADHNLMYKGIYVIAKENF